VISREKNSPSEIPLCGPRQVGVFHRVKVKTKNKKMKFRNKFKLLTAMFFMSAVFLFSIIIAKAEISPASNVTEPIEAQEVSQKNPLPLISINDLEINEIKDSHILGAFSLTNMEDRDISGIGYKILLLQKDGQGMVSVGIGEDAYGLVDVKIYYSSLFLPVVTGKGQNVNFDYIYPKIIVSGDYVLAVMPITETGFELGFSKKDIQITGNNNFLTMEKDSCWLIKNGKKVGTGIGYIYEPNQTPSYTCTVENNTEKSITANFKITITSHSTNYQKTIKEFSGQPITISSNGKQALTIDLPVFSEPTVYLASMVLVDQNQDIVSPFMKARWTVPGESAKVINLEMDKNYYQKGDIAKTTIYYAGSGDLYWKRETSKDTPEFSPTAGTNVQSAKIELTILDSDKNICGQFSENVDVKDNNFHTLEKDITITRNCLNPTIQVKISSSSGKSLTDYAVKFTSSNVPEEKTKISAKTIAMIIIVILLIIAIIMLIKKKITSSQKNG
jgi:hypothetical protein